MDKLLTSLGTGKYDPVLYRWQEREYRTKLFPEALVEWLRPAKTVVFLTERSEGHPNWVDLQQALQSKTEIQPVRISEGRSEAELWEIFDRVTESVADGETVTIDITHAFRSLPLVFFVVTAFLRSVREVNVQHILYGCFEGEDKPAQVLDLIMMMDLLDWMEGVRRFRETWDASRLSHLLTHSAQGSDKQRQRLKQAGDGLRNLSAQLQMVRTLDLLTTAQRLGSQIERARHTIESSARPFALLLEHTREQVQRIAYDSPQSLSLDALRKQLEILRLYVEHERLLQAALLEGEWLLNFALWKYAQFHGDVDWLKYREREKVKRAIEQATDGTQRDHLTALDFMNPDELHKVAELWSKVADLRNDLAHCGMRREPKPYEALRKKIIEYAKEMDALLEQCVAEA